MRRFRSVVCARRAVERFASLSGRVVLDHLAGNLVPAGADEGTGESCVAALRAAARPMIGATKSGVLAAIVHAGHHQRMKVLGVSIDQLKSLTEVVSGDPSRAIVWEAKGELEMGLPLLCTCWGDETRDGRVSFSCMVSVADRHRHRILGGFEGYGRTRNIAIRQALLEAATAGLRDPSDP